MYTKMTMLGDTVTIAVDAMGGDSAPGAVLDGVRLAIAADRGLRVLLVGPADVVEPHASERVRTVAAAEVIAMNEHPAAAVRQKRDSSIVVCARTVRQGEAAGFFSAGNTGACMAAATLVIGRSPGVIRPAIATVIPGASRPSVLLDIGANADVKPEMLLQFAAMGRAYATVVLGVAEPSIGLLNIGEEPTKGSQLALEAHALLAERAAGFVGNVEGRDLSRGSVDVIVTDGFTGNVALKVLEGLAATLFGQIKDVFNASPLTRLAAAAVRPGLTALKERIDPDRHGGAPLLGVNGVAIIGHGSSSPLAVASGIAVAARAARGGLTARIAEGIGATDQPDG